MTPVEGESAEQPSQEKAKSVDESAPGRDQMEATDGTVTEPVPGTNQAEAMDGNVSESVPGKYHADTADGSVSHLVPGPPMPRSDSEPGSWMRSNQVIGFLAERQPGVPRKCRTRGGANVSQT